MQINSIGNAKPAIVADITTPDGKMFVIMEEDENGRMDRVQIMLGKAGSAIAAWAFALSSMINISLKNKATITEILEALSGTTSDRLAFTASKKIPVRSGPDGVAIALLEFLEHKAEEANQGNGHIIFRGYNR